MFIPATCEGVVGFGSRTIIDEMMLSSFEFTEEATEAFKHPLKGKDKRGVVRLLQTIV